MSPTALLLVLVAALCHSAWNLIVKSDARRLEIQSGALVVGTLLCAPVLLFHPPWSLPPLAWAAVAVSALFESAYVLALTSAYGAGDMSLVYPVARGTGTVLVAPLAVLLLGERPSLQGALGIGLVVFGIFLSHGALGGWAAARAHRRAVGWALLTGAMIAGYSLVNKVGVTLVPVPLYAFLVFLTDAVLVRLVQRWRGGSVPALRRGRALGPDRRGRRPDDGGLPRGAGRDVAGPGELRGRDPRDQRGGGGAARRARAPRAALGGAGGRRGRDLRGPLRDRLGPLTGGRGEADGARWGCSRAAWWPRGRPAGAGGHRGAPRSRGRGDVSRPRGFWYNHRPGGDPP